MGRRRKRDKHLPQRVYFESGRYWFKPKLSKNPPPGTKRRIDLGTTESEMYSNLAQRAAPTAMQSLTVEQEMALNGVPFPVREF